MKIPKLLRPLYDGWMKVSHGIGLVISSILLTVFWIIVFGLYAIILKAVALFGKKYLQTSYWCDVSEEQTDFLRQF